jgi:hypothetical protein
MALRRTPVAGDGPGNGSAGWKYRLIVELLLGLRLEVDKLYFAPCLYLENCHARTQGPGLPSCGFWRPKPTTVPEHAGQGVSSVSVTKS